MDNIAVQKLFREVIQRLGFQNQGYILTISRRLTYNYGYANVLQFLETGNREIVISENHVRSHSRSRVLDTIVHEIAHLIQYIEAFKKLGWFRRKRRIGFRFNNERIIAHLKAFPTFKARNNKKVYYWRPRFMHNNRFIDILEDLKSKLEIRP